jgi:hypothetical protein
MPVVTKMKLIGTTIRRLLLVLMKRLVPTLNSRDVLDG